MKKHLQTRGYIRSGAIARPETIRLFGEIAEEQLEALALALLESRLRSLILKGGKKIN